MFEPAKFWGIACLNGAGRVSALTLAGECSLGHELREPSHVALRVGVPVGLTFTRTSEKTCATSVVFAALSIRRDLPLNQPVAIEFTPKSAGEIAFACGMNMLRGTVVIR